MLTHDDFLAAIRADPADEAPWLQYADWLLERGDPWADVVRTREVVNAVGMHLVLLPPGVFVMGSPPEEEGRKLEEGPRHEVALTRPFGMGATPVTQGQYEAVMGSNPSHFQAGQPGGERVAGLDTGHFPVEQVSWHDAVEFCRRLSALPEERDAGRAYRLPTEAEWEYASRGNAAGYQVFHTGNALSSEQANFDGNLPYGRARPGPYLGRTCRVKSYPPSAWGLFDLHGNVWEWCADWYDGYYYGVSPREDPAGPARGAGRVVRGGSWFYFGQYCRSAYRVLERPGQRDPDLGFRVVVAPAGRGA